MTINNQFRKSSTKVRTIFEYFFALLNYTFVETSSFHEAWSVRQTIITNPHSGYNDVSGFGSAHDQLTRGCKVLISLTRRWWKDAQSHVNPKGLEGWFMPKGNALNQKNKKFLMLLLFDFLF